jgi:hypothetical protein
MNSNQIRSLSDSVLLANLKSSVLEERKLTTEVLEYLREIDRRRLYAESGHASLWDFCTKELGYSEGSASRRISSMRLLRDLPDLKEDLLAGKQNLSSLAQAQKFFRIEEKHREVKLSLGEKQEVLEKLEGKSTRECEKELLKLSSAPIEIMKSEKQRSLDDKHTELRLVLNSDLLEKLNRIQALRSHSDPSMSYAELLGFMADEVLKRLDPMEKEKRRTKPKKEPQSVSPVFTAEEVFRSMASRKVSSPPAPEVQKTTDSQKGSFATQSNSFGPALKMGRRAPIPARIKRLIWLRDQGKCAYTNPETGKICESRYFLEIDHVHPVALGGGNDPENLRLRCRAHNQRSAVRIFGAREE